MSKKMSQRTVNVGRSVLFFILPLFVLGFTSVSFLSKFSLHMGVVLFLVAFGLSFAKNVSQTLKTVIHSLIILFLVGGTGWFLSPFFFLLYLLPIYLGFLYVPMVAFSFLAAILIIFSSSVGEVDISFDIMTLLSLLLVIPLVIYLRKKFLVLRQTDKDILILHDESGIKDIGTIAGLLANKVTNLGVTVRQPLTFINQAAKLLEDEDLTEKEATTLIHRIHTTAAETLQHIRTFEGETSSNEVLSNQSVAEDTNQPISDDVSVSIPTNKTIKKP
jgi:hypothetical protein